MNVLVTGGGGFLGKAIVKILLAREWNVRSFSRSEYPELTEMGVEHRCGALDDYPAVKAAVEGCDIVFHVAAKAGVWGPYEEYYQSNVVGTENVIRACRECGVDKLVYTSSPSVVFDGNNMEGSDETAPYPDHYHAPYPKTKAIAEKMVLAASDDSLATVALRPHLIWGPEDNHIVPRLLERGKKGALRKIGKSECLVDTIYITNAAVAHLQAADKLAIGSVVSGKAYFLANDEPRPLWGLINDILAAGDVPPVTRTIPASVAYAVGTILEHVYRTFNLSGEPRMTRFVAREMGTAHWFNLGNAKRDFGYEPQVSIDEGLKRLREWLQKQ